MEPARRLLPIVLPAILVGIGSSLAYLGLNVIANQLEDVLWDTLPTALGLSGEAPLWILLMLTVSGAAVGLIVTFVPGHAGPDPATIELAAPPMPLAVLPGLALALVVMLAGGVSLGPENPILAVTIGLAVAIGLRFLPDTRAAMWASLAFAATIGAMFGTPIAAALLLTESMASSGTDEPIWDRLFGPLVAATAGAIMTDLASGESFVLAVAPYPGAQPFDLASSALIATGAALLGLAAIYLFPRAHALFRRLGTPLVTLTVGGFILGILGVVGGPITLFKGLTQMKTLTEEADAYTALTLLGFGLIKLGAMVVASTSGFRGGRIFPSVFAAVALGLAVSAAFPTVPQALAVGAATVGLLVAVARSGWLALFMAALMVGDATLLPILLVAVLPAWLLVTGRPEMVVRLPEPSPPQPARASPTTAS